MKTEMTRKNFLFGSVATALGAASVAPAMAAPGGKSGSVDPNLSVLISDPHVNGRAKDSAPFMKYAIKTVQAILALNPRPANVVVLGDVSEGNGQPVDYAKIAQLFKPLEDAGMKVTYAMGNHDNRENFVKQFPSYAKTTLVPGRVVSKVSLGAADLIVLDSLQQGRGDGFLCDAQKAWLTENAPKWTRPTFLAIHHPVNEMRMKGTSFAAFICSLPNVKALIHGHEHRWHPSWFYGQWGRSPIVRTLGIPSTSSFGDNGWTVVRTTDKGMTVSLYQHDFCWLSPLPEDRKPSVWKDIIANHQNQVCTFSF